MLAVTTALMRLSVCAAEMAKPPLPQMPSAAIFSRSTKPSVPRKSTPAEKSSEKISGEEV